MHRAETGLSCGDGPNFSAHREEHLADLKPVQKYINNQPARSLMLHGPCMDHKEAFQESTMITG